MTWAVYADLSRPISADEQTAISAEIEHVIPGGGCVDPTRAAPEVYFTVNAASQRAAEQQAKSYIDEVLARSGSSALGYSLEVRVLHAKQ